MGSSLLRDEERQAPPEDGSLRRNGIGSPANIAAPVAGVLQVPSQGLHRGQIWQYADQGYADAVKMLSQRLRNRPGTERIFLSRGRISLFREEPGSAICGPCGMARGFTGRQGESAHGPRGERMRNRGSFRTEETLRQRIW
jgi:hypothetical protein